MSRKKPPITSRTLYVKRILLVIVFLGLSCIFFGFIVFIAGRIFNALTLSQIGAGVLLIGVAFVALRVFYWILEGIVGRGVDELSKQADSV
jgi:cell shape-determining protein MreD